MANKAPPSILPHCGPPRKGQPWDPFAQAFGQHLLSKLKTWVED